MSENLNILVVDDDEKIGRLFSDMFKEEGHSVQPVCTGEDAVEAYQKNPFHIVFLDMILPGMNGLETLKALKNFDANVRVVLMTGYSILGMLEDATRIGIITTLVKPFYFEQIKQAIDKSIRPAEAFPVMRAYNALIIDETMELFGKLENLFKDMKFEIHACKNVNDLSGIMGAKEFDLILISSSVLERNTMQTFYYVKERMPASKCILLVDEYMDINEIINNIREIFQDA